MSLGIERAIIRGIKLAFYSRYDATNYALSSYIVDMALGRGVNIPQSTIDLSFLLTIQID